MEFYPDESPPLETQEQPRQAAFAPVLGVAVVALLSGYFAALFLHGQRGSGPAWWAILSAVICLGVTAWATRRGVGEHAARRRELERLRHDELRQREELVRLTAELERHANEATEANLRLSEVERLKSQFLANMSHELRTPLNSIIGFSGILHKHLAQDLNDRHARFLTHIHSSGEHLLQVINDILDLSRVEAGSLEFNIERFSMKSVIDGITSVLQDSARRRGVSFRIEAAHGLPAIEADVVRVKQILYNLVANAVKFSYEDSEVTIRARHLAADDATFGLEAIELAVTDRGIGIEPRERELIFQEFYQVDAGTDREFAGTGLGLALVRRFVELHRGTVTVTSAVGKGSTFTVTLPLRYQGPLGGIEGGRYSPRDGEGRPLSGVIAANGILVVEDDPTAYDKISRDLGEAGYQTVRAKNGAEALLLARRLRPLAITLDLVLPDADGLDVLRSLKADPAMSHIPVIIISMLDSRELGLTLGADDYFVKPPDPRRLMRRLHELVAPGARARPRVLLIDDEEALHDLVAETLDEQDYELDHAYSGAEGVALARERDHDVIVLDLMMDGMDGFEAATLIKAEATTARIPIVVLTAKDMTAADREILSGKIEALIEKGERASSRLGPLIQELVRRRAGELVEDER